MPHCPSCASDVPQSNRFCGVCGAAVSVVVSAAATVAMPRRSASSSSSSSGSLDEGRFPAGTLLAERYRIIGLLGRGGMGEVYRANDLKLGQPVALKFLPESMAGNQSLLARFHGEVRIARQVSHPNVCRVYDIGEYEGMPYLTMEYLDGEDLASLLRRIGRLPGDKAVEIARKLCAGLAAAHDKGVLHRDLKPANIMIDGRGQVLIMDFGLAGLAGQIEGGEVRNGTPAYMAPEQIEGREVTVRSDVYSLGLVLYEIFTGKRVYDDARRDAPPTVSSIVKDIDPAIERVIQRCLETDPRGRPTSALAVAAALPGGDALAAALAAGETPSPELVAAAGDTDTVAVRTIRICCAIVLVGIVAVAILGRQINLLEQMPSEYSADTLAQKAADLIRSFGYTDRPADRAFGLSNAGLFRRYAQQQEKPEVYAAQLAAGQPPVIYLWYRQSPREMIPQSRQPGVDQNDPPFTDSGMVACNVDTLGRLISFRAVPPQFEKSPAAPAQPFDWNLLFRAAGLDPAHFHPADPQWVPLAGFDTRAAWTGAHTHAPDVPIRIEAAAWRGKPVYFETIGPWTTPARMQRTPQTTGQKVSAWLSILLLFVICLVAAGLAWRNYRLKRSDGRGSVRLAAFALGCWVFQWACLEHHTATQQEFSSFTWALGVALFNAAMLWTLYMALEPYVRRRWPHSLISWSRLLAGGWRDAMVGGHLLIGSALGIGFTILFFLRELAARKLGSSVGNMNMNTVVSTRWMAGEFAVMLFQAVNIALFMFVTFFLLRSLLRRPWLAALVFTVLFVLGSAAGDHPLVHTTFAGVTAVMVLVILVRFGLLPMVIGILVSSVLPQFPLTTDFSTWYAGSTIFAITVVAALTSFATYTALAGRAFFGGKLLEE